VERNYSTTEKECLAIVWFVIRLRPYLEGQRFIIRTDHHSLRWVLNLADAQGRLARWRLRLLEFDYEVQYSPGRSHHGADSMSRLKPADATPSEKPVDTEIPCFTVQSEDEPELVTLDRLRDLQEEDPDCQFLTHFLSSDSSVEVDAAGVLGKLLPSGEFQIQIPRTLQDSLPVTLVTNPSDFSKRRDFPISRPLSS
jgi:hypothetical protein